MKDYTSDAPVWSDSIPIVEKNDLINDKNDNARAIQLIQNDLFLQATKVDKEEGKSLVSDAERTEWNAMYQQATGYTDQKIADLIGGASSTLDTLGEIEKAMRENDDVVEALDAAIGSKASQKEMESLLGTKLDKTGDAKDNTITFGSSDTTTPSAWTDVDVLKSGETLKSFAQKVSSMFKNIRYLWKMLGSTDISAISDGTVTGAISELNTGMLVSDSEIKNIKSESSAGWKKCAVTTATYSDYPGETVYLAYIPAADIVDGGKYRCKFSGAVFEGIAGKFASGSQYFPTVSWLTSKTRACTPQNIHENEGGCGSIGNGKNAYTLNTVGAIVMMSTVNKSPEAYYKMDYESFEDFTDKFENDPYIDIARAYVKNGSVVIIGYLLPASSGSYKIDIPSGYRPHGNIAGNYFMSTGNDAGCVIACYTEGNSKIAIWTLKSNTRNITFSFVYPVGN